MHATTVLVSLLSLTGFTALATPVPSGSETSGDHINALARRTNVCLAEDGAIKRWAVNIDNDSAYNKQCGGGCLDNIRGRCGVVTDWGCERNGLDTGLYRFKTSAFCSLNDMTQALHACTGLTINCSNGRVD
ncbi:hypothetical protein MPH_10237 [Macrophomina phaseolina MS6]|uniref:Uncharacterized protein n=2 Tax=Macrophomina phaseolina TaxID=35725 RepID=K2RDK5_MACPH|nr:hypothetical protein MPH_10237 [Macrophomina phaseolina MS6]KAH7044648.1 hypothetical protein B0J12DRAFT_730207 [Macrophomina phaseolina]